MKKIQIFLYHSVILILISRYFNFNSCTMFLLFKPNLHKVFNFFLNILTKLENLK